MNQIINYAVRFVCIVSIVLLIASCDTEFHDVPEHPEIFSIKAHADVPVANEHLITDFMFGNEILKTYMETDLVFSRAKAIACQEGYYAGNTVAWRNKNPGNLKAGGTIDKVRHTIYNTHIEGWLALYEFLYRYRHLTIKQIGKFYAEDTAWSKGVQRCAQ